MIAAASVGKGPPADEGGACKAQRSESVTSAVDRPDAGAMLSSENPQIRRRDLEPVSATRKRRAGVRPERHVVQMEHVLPAVAKKHGRRELGLDAVLPGTPRHAHTLEADHAHTRLARLGAGSRATPQRPTLTLQQGATIAQFGDRSWQPIAAAHEVGGEQRVRDVVHLLWRSL